jgi:hypothetical protein
MLKKFGFFKKLSEAENVKRTLQNADASCKKIVASKLPHLDILNYQYSTREAMEELGLDDELVHQLVEDYVTQIIKSTLQFEKHLLTLEESNNEAKELDFTPLRELAHKNLGVARNLRIKDGEKLLKELMEKDDLEYLNDCLEALKACSVKLKPECAYNTLKLIEVKSSL